MYRKAIKNVERPFHPSKSTFFIECKEPKTLRFLGKKLLFNTQALIKSSLRSLQKEFVVLQFPEEIFPWAFSESRKNAANAIKTMR